EAHVWEAGEQLQIDFVCSVDLFDRATIRRMLRHYERLLEAVVAEPEAPISTLSLLGADERRQVLQAWNETAAAYPQPRCVHELVEEQARERPQALAVACGARELTYKELDERAQWLAAELCAHGV